MSDQHNVYVLLCERVAPEALALAIQGTDPLFPVGKPTQEGVEIHKSLLQGLLSVQRRWYPKELEQPLQKFNHLHQKKLFQDKGLRGLKAQVQSLLDMISFVNTKRRNVSTQKRQLPGIQEILETASGSPYRALTSTEELPDKAAKLPRKYEKEPTEESLQDFWQDLAERESVHSVVDLLTQTSEQPGSCDDKALGDKVIYTDHCSGLLVRVQANSVESAEMFQKPGSPWLWGRFGDGAEYPSEVPKQIDSPKKRPAAAATKPAAMKKPAGMKKPAVAEDACSVYITQATDQSYLQFKDPATGTKRLLCGISKARRANHQDLIAVVRAELMKLDLRSMSFEEVKDKSLTIRELAVNRGHAHSPQDRLKKTYVRAQIVSVTRYDSTRSSANARTWTRVTRSRATRDRRPPVRVEGVSGQCYAVSVVHIGLDFRFLESKHVYFRKALAPTCVCLQILIVFEFFAG